MVTSPPVRYRYATKDVVNMIMNDEDEQSTQDSIDLDLRNAEIMSHTSESSHKSTSETDTWTASKENTSRKRKASPQEQTAKFDGTPVKKVKSNTQSERSAKTPKSSNKVKLESAETPKSRSTRPKTPKTHGSEVATPKSSKKPGGDSSVSASRTPRSGHQDAPRSSARRRLTTGNTPSNRRASSLKTVEYTTDELGNLSSRQVEPEYALSSRGRTRWVKTFGSVSKVSLK